MGCVASGSTSSWVLSLCLGGRVPSTAECFGVRGQERLGPQQELTAKTESEHPMAWARRAPSNQIWVCSPALLPTMKKLFSICGEGEGSI